MLQDHPFDSRNGFRKLPETSMHLLFHRKPSFQFFGVGPPLVTKTSSHLLSHRHHFEQKSVLPHCESPNNIKKDFLFHKAFFSAAHYTLT